MPSQFAAPRLPPRFWDKVIPEPNSGCWIWLGARCGIDVDGGYGKIRVEKRSRYAHRIAYETLVGAVSEGRQLDHKCRVRCCVNPDHLEPVSQRENIIRGVSPSAVNATKRQCPHGHDLAGDNLVANNLLRGERKCRRCKNERGRIYQRDRRAALRAGGEA